MPVYPLRLVSLAQLSAVDTDCAPIYHVWRVLWSSETRCFSPEDVYTPTPQLKFLKWLFPLRIFSISPCFIWVLSIFTFNHRRCFLFFCSLLLYSIFHYFPEKLHESQQHCHDFAICQRPQRKCLKIELFGRDTPLSNIDSH
jgi:hypothetical protein